MKRSEFSYRLPEHLIAQYPAQRREDSRLLSLNRLSGNCLDRLFYELPELLSPGDLLVFNDSRVIPARLFGSKSSGGKVEILVERVIGDRQLLCQIRASKAPKTGSGILLEGNELVVERREGELYVLSHDGPGLIMDLLDRHGHMPLPPYIRREDTQTDRDRYQTVYARNPGAVAAPTAGLHFSRELLDTLQRRGIDSGFVTLHVGAGTFKPVRVDDVADHVMHREWFTVDRQLCEAVQRTRANGGRVIAVGTTVVRCLESAARDNELQPMARDTDIFIYPGYKFRVIDGLITNFHLPESTLLMLVCAFAGMSNTLRAYERAVAGSYRFFSYGDAMLIL